MRNPSRSTLHEGRRHPTFRARRSQSWKLSSIYREAVLNFLALEERSLIGALRGRIIAAGVVPTNFAAAKVLIVP
jgi:hypothetical protein